ncbi:hypothetical protein PRIPAC_72617 [Pristionchus pacificus]|uniref:Uncharacterized protein n=1 Tax=Pristionchus pacificus TaxID=54126 RepID=A0A2A6C5Y3_PRIPA|nr:hypothetical protein PRIPAC_72617 [Pristionchus pacificus]|eukprot:PDM73517.1 hypothetical protein PRIPAC_40873 [Pristionchus pacificus]
MDRVNNIRSNNFPHGGGGSGGAETAIEVNHVDGLKRSGTIYLGPPPTPATTERTPPPALDALITLSLRQSSNPPPIEVSRKWILFVGAGAGVVVAMLALLYGCRSAFCKKLTLVDSPKPFKDDNAQVAEKQSISPP